MLFFPWVDKTIHCIRYEIFVNFIYIFVKIVQRKKISSLILFLYFIFFRLTFSDSLLIIDSFIQKSLLPYFTSKSPLEPDWFKITNPYFWHPFKGIIVTVTIYLMVAISAERFRAVCYPLSKRQVRLESLLIFNLGKIM